MIPKRVVVERSWRRATSGALYRRHDIALIGVHVGYDDGLDDGGGFDGGFNFYSALMSLRFSFEEEGDDTLCGISETLVRDVEKIAI